jgi:uncharacterized membrane protein
MNPFTLPVHPAVVHFPLAMLAAAWVCLLAGHATGKQHWRDRERLFEAIGVWTLPLAFVGGFVDTRGFEPLSSPRFDQPLIWHIIAATAGCAAYAARFVWSRHPAIVRRTRQWATTDVVLATAGLWLLVLAGTIAGEMVYGV